jgi:hypothetical protein
MVADQQFKRIGRANMLLYELTPGGFRHDFVVAQVAKGEEEAGSSISQCIQ